MNSSLEEELTELYGIVYRHSPGNFFIFRSDHLLYLDHGDATILLSYLLNRFRTGVGSNKKPNPAGTKRLLKNNLFFKCPAKDIETDLGMKRRRRDSALSRLKEKNLIEMKKKGVPCTVWIKINQEGLNDIDKWAQNTESSLYEARKLDCTKRPN